MVNPMRFVLVPLALVALAGCQPPNPDGKAADAPAAAKPAAMDISRPITARGNEPFWAITITDGAKFRLQRPDHPDLIAEAPGAAMSPDGATWVAKGAKGEQLTVTLRPGECSDGMSDLKYPMSAEVVLLHESLYGCAANTSELPREGG